MVGLSHGLVARRRAGEQGDEPLALTHTAGKALWPLVIAPAPRGLKSSVLWDCWGMAGQGVVRCSSESLTRCARTHRREGLVERVDRGE